MSSCNADVYEHYTRRDDLPKKYCHYMVECRHCRLAFEECSMGTARHPNPQFRRIVKESDVFVTKNSLPQMVSHVKTCIYAQAIIQEVESAEAQTQERSRVSNSSKSSSFQQNPFQPHLNAPFTASQTSEFHRLLLNLTVAAGLPFSWVEMEETGALFRHVRKVIN